MVPRNKCFSRCSLLLQKGEGKRGEAERVLLEDVQESIADMVQIMQSYRNKNMVSRVFVSTLCKRRQEEAEAAINSTVQRLQVGDFFSSKFFVSCLVSLCFLFFFFTRLFSYSIS